MNRKKLIVDRQQLWFCAKVMFFSNLLPLMLSFLGFFAYSRLRHSDALAQLCSHPAGALNQLENFVPHLLVSFIVLNLAVTALTLLFFSNRIFGPIYNAKQKLMKLANGITEFSTIRFRENDEFGYLEEVLNQIKSKFQKVS